MNRKKARIKVKTQVHQKTKQNQNEQKKESILLDCMATMLHKINRAGKRRKQRRKMNAYDSIHKRLYRRVDEQQQKNIEFYLPFLSYP